ncbi:MAG: hypothetical protein RLN89_06030 [Parvibaculum sp.]
MIGAMMKNFLQPLILALTLTSLCACVSLPPEGAAATDTCRDLLRRVDMRVSDRGLADAEATRVPGFPYLKVDRLLASFKTELEKGMRPAAAFDDWIKRLRALDRTSRQIELQNLGAENISGMIDDCANLLLEADFGDPSFPQALVDAIRPPRHYDDGARALGLYPLAQFGVAFGFDRWKQDNLSSFEADPGQWRETELRYSLPATSAPNSLKEDAAAALIDFASNNALGIADLEGSVLADMAARYAPVFAIEQATEADRIGRPIWHEDGTPGTDPADPVLYVRLAHTRFDGEVLPQLVYSIWFPARPKTGPFDILGGAMDGLYWRVTLDRAGKPLLYDSFHACGCYHLFFPAPSVTRVRVAEDDDFREEPLVPIQALELAAGERMIVHIAPTSHYVRGLSVARDQADAIPLRWQNELRLVDEMAAPHFGLRSVDDGMGGARSFFSSDGLMRGTERTERFLLWPMGIASAGAMRQWGTHATAFAGERHADDPSLLNEAFAR